VHVSQLAIFSFDNLGSGERGGDEEGKEEEEDEGEREVDEVIF
jgi:hypothetical protein